MSVSSPISAVKKVAECPLEEESSDSAPQLGMETPACRHSSVGCRPAFFFTSGCACGFASVVPGAFWGACGCAFFVGGAPTDCFDGCYAASFGACGFASFGAAVAAGCFVASFGACGFVSFGAAAAAGCFAASFGARGFASFGAAAAAGCFAASFGACGFASFGVAAAAGCFAASFNACGFAIFGAVCRCWLVCCHLWPLRLCFCRRCCLCRLCR